VEIPSEKEHFQHQFSAESERVTLYRKGEVSRKLIEEETMNDADLRLMMLSLLIALSTIMVNLSELQLGFFAIIMLVSFLRQDQPRQQDKRRNRRRRK